MLTKCKIALSCRREADFGPGMQVKLENQCFRVKNIKKNARILNLSFEGMSHAKLMFFKKHVENNPENRQAREATLWGMSHAKLMFFKKTAAKQNRKIWYPAASKAIQNEFLDIKLVRIAPPCGR